METFRICTGVANDTWHLNLIVDVFAAILQSIKELPHGVRCAASSSTSPRIVTAKCAKTAPNRLQAKHFVEEPLSTPGSAKMYAVICCQYRGGFTMIYYDISAEKIK